MVRISPEARRARILRGDMPVAERILWSRLRRAALGHRFRRQHPVGPYVADFACVAARVLVEVDGPSHVVHEVARRYDAARDAYLTDAGWVVIRVTNDEVRRELDGVLTKVRTACDGAVLALHEARPSR